MKKNSKRVQKIIDLYEQLETECDGRPLGVMIHGFDRDEFSEDDWTECDVPNSMDYRGKPNLVLFLNKD